ncbi:hypothetical protein [Desulfonatronum thioautotrophicum]|uniref:hypothetical protein n=1 Tax=Desulfonatronum thioautotrophicum TaxID=617001 RepID=UPI0005EB7222|nr:hypothetical protein [Desulfonatronum thioautotrophicum]
MLRRGLILFVLAAFLSVPGLVAAHTPLFACFDNADGTIYCEGGFSDGSTAAGIPIIVTDGAGEVIKTLELSRNSDIEFDKPEGEFSVLFDGGEGHDILIPGSQIFE